MGPIDVNANLDPDPEDTSGACVYSGECSGVEVCAVQLKLVFAGREPGYVVFAVCVGDVTDMCCAQVHVLPGC